MKLADRILIFLFVAVSLQASASAISNVNGLGDFVDLGQQVYIAALSTEQPVSSSDEILSRDMAALMQIRIVSERLSPRRFMRYWLESSMVNVSSDTMAAHSTAFNRLAKAFRGGLTQGDLVSLYYQPGVGLSVSVNDIQLEMYSDTTAGGFFRVLLRSWIGDVPLSSSIRRGLLSAGAVDPQLMKTFASLRYSPERKAEIAKWQAELTEERKLAVDAEVVEVKQTSSDTEQTVGETALQDTGNNVAIGTNAESVESPPGLAKTLNEALPETIANANSIESKLPQKEAHTGAIGVDKISEIGTQAQAVTKDLGNKNTAQALPAKTIAKNKESSRVIALASQAAEAAQTASDIETPIKNLVLSPGDKVESVSNEAALLVKEQYFADLVSAALKHQTLPRQAFQRRLEGDVKVLLTLNRDGLIVTAKLEEASPYDFFNKQALEAVEDAAPYAPVPKVMDGETFEFSLPFSYRLPY